MTKIRQNQYSRVHQKSYFDHFGGFPSNLPHSASELRVISYWSRVRELQRYIQMWHLQDSSPWWSRLPILYKKENTPKYSESHHVIILKGFIRRSRWFSYLSFKYRSPYFWDQKYQKSYFLLLHFGICFQFDFLNLKNSLSLKQFEIFHENPHWQILKIRRMKGGQQNTPVSPVSNTRYTSASWTRQKLVSVRTCNMDTAVGRTGYGCSSNLSWDMRID
jgi:hypothetical protein